MSRIHRALEKADREGLLTWTNGAGEATLPPPAEPAPVAVAAPRPRVTRPPEWELPPEPQAWAPAAPLGPTPSATEVQLSPMFVAALSPSSAAAEHYRLLRARLERQEKGRRRQVIVVTSSRAGDGKTTTSANLALTMAQEYGQRVVLVEGDLRRPTLAQQFGLTPGPGIVDVLVGAASLESALTELPEYGLHVLPAGLPTARSGGLIASAALRRLVENLRGRFDRIIVDAPPANIADTHGISRIADGVLFVVRAGVTPRAAVEKALEEMDAEKLLGVVLNDSVATDDTGGYAYADAPRDAARG